MTGATLTFTDLTKAYGDTVAVDHLTATIRPGVVTGFLGPNGAGKSTALRCLLGLAAPTSGLALVDGKPYAELADPARSVGALLETRGFHPGLTGRQNLDVVATAAGIPRSRVQEVLELVGLADAAHRRAKQYSMGMRQRLSLGAALLGDPQTLVMDEPANGLDPQAIVWLRSMLRGFADEGRTVLVSSHQLSEMENTVHDVLIIDHGSLKASGPIDAVRQGRTLEQAFLDITTGMAS
jgi:ABC-2 type transport system ATP-binding protein